MIKRSRPKIIRQVADKRPQTALPDDGKSQVLSKEAQGLKDEPAAVRITGEDDYWIIRECNCSRLKDALGIDDNDFCEGIYQQLDNLLSIEDGTQNRRNFDFVLSVVRSPKPVDKLHAMQLIQMAVVQLSAMRQSEILLKRISYELPADVAVALHRADWNAGRMEKQRIKIDDQSVRQAGERMVTRLMQTYALQLQSSAAYRRSAEASKVQQVPAITVGQALLTGCTKATPHNAQKTQPSRELNGSRQSAAQLNEEPKQQIYSTDIQNSNGHTPT
jgi:hypothetical protein